MQIFFVFIFLILLMINKFNNHIKDQYYQYHQIFEVSDNYKKNNIDPFY